MRRRRLAPDPLAVLAGLVLVVGGTVLLALLLREADLPWQPALVLIVAWTAAIAFGAHS